MAEKIQEGAENSEADIEVETKRVEEVDMEELTEYDSIILGSPTYYGLPCSQIKEFIDESITHHGKLNGMIGGAFTSSSNTAGGNETTIMALLEALLVHGMIVKGMPNGDHYGPVVVGDPDKKEIDQCQSYGRRMAELTDKIADKED